MLKQITVGSIFKVDIFVKNKILGMITNLRFNITNTFNTIVLLFSWYDLLKYHFTKINEALGKKTQNSILENYLYNFG